MADIARTRLILASSSPRREQLLREAGLHFDVVPPPVPEPAEEYRHLAPAAQAEALAYFKAASVSATNPQAWVLGADTICAADGQVMGKPADVADARRMLRTLSRRPHVVITGVALRGPGDKRLVASDTTTVTMRPMSDEEIESYIASGEWEGKAGAYAIQETADRYVVKLEGSRSNVVGLPMELLGRMMGRMGILPPVQEAT